MPRRRDRPFRSRSRRSRPSPCPLLLPIDQAPRYAPTSSPRPSTRLAMPAEPGGRRWVQALCSCRELNLDVCSRRDSRLDSLSPSPSGRLVPNRRTLPCRDPASPLHPSTQSPTGQSGNRNDLVGSMHALNHDGRPSPRQVRSRSFFWRCRFRGVVTESVPHKMAGAVLINWSVTSTRRLSNSGARFFPLFRPFVRGRSRSFLGKNPGPFPSLRVERRFVW